MGSRPRLKPDFRPLRRGRGAVQLGSSAATGGIIVAGLAPAEIALIDRLDGSLPEEDLYAAAASAGVDRARAGQLLGLLRTHRVLLTDTRDDGGAGHDGDRRVGDDRRDDGPLAETSRGDPASAPGPWPPRVGRQRVVVDGSGPFPGSVAALLRAAGVRRVDAGPWAADVADAELRDTRRRSGTRTGGAAPTAGAADLERGSRVEGSQGMVLRPALVVLVAHGGLDARAGDPWRRRGVPVLPVVVDGGRVVVGPVVGTDPALPCLRCVQLTRIDRDAAWLYVVAQAARSGRGAGGPDGEVGGSEPPELRADIASVAAGVTAMVAQTTLRGDPVPAGVSVEVTTSWPRLDHRRWPRHPACSAHEGTHARRPDGDRVAGLESPGRGAAGLG